MQEKEELKKIERKDIENYFSETFLSNQMSLEIHISHNFFADQNAFQLEQREKDQKNFEIIKILEKEKFKRDGEYFPFFY